jgi:hypothetical protein
VFSDGLRCPIKRYGDRYVGSGVDQDLVVAEQRSGGPLRRSGRRVRISANLIECAGETTIWSDRFESELSDIFALQDSIAAAVAAALDVVFAPRAAVGAIDLRPTISTCGPRCWAPAISSTTPRAGR